MSSPHDPAWRPDVSGIIVLGADGQRIACKHYEHLHQAGGSHGTHDAEVSLEASLYQAANNSSLSLWDDAEVILLGGHIVVYRRLGRLLFAVVGHEESNELVLVRLVPRMLWSRNCCFCFPPLECMNYALGNRVCGPACFRRIPSLTHSYCAGRQAFWMLSVTLAASFSLAP
jgi:hypothetical protein